MRVIIGARIDERLRAAGLSQSELARRVKLRQSTISGLIKGEQRSTTHLHKIARELGTTPAYLEGETEDPQADAPSSPELSHEQRDLVELFAGIGAKERGALTLLARAIAAKAPPPPPTAQAVSLPDLLPGEEALAQMFEALLMAMDRSAPLDEQARLLARRLPIGLSQLQDLLPAGGTPEDATPSQLPSTPVPARP
ncbi:XRE family transcriptional regulator [Sphingomonas sp. ABOLF]|uniref:helix-turn-helix domain-containing protein n=1 Tax=Sphingomonas sp. ABOLF TaxID=1985879 RepID=UPI000F7DC6C2|nr:helix-turn-helix transcriptional regulator [Sphingomonas sp. ABOLF]RSV15177.1 XRE family transcriptional regulator [Sphingomonas sp. ABOLF]